MVFLDVFPDLQRKFSSLTSSFSLEAERFPRWWAAREMRPLVGGRAAMDLTYRSQGLILSTLADMEPGTYVLVGGEC